MKNFVIIIFFISVLLLISVCVPQISDKVYYVDCIEGNDENDGLTEETAWETLDKTNTADLKAGETVLFKKGCSWHGNLYPKSGTDAGHITYSSYGTGEKPTIMGSVNKSNTGDWIDEGSNVWRSEQTFSTDIGNLIFDNASSFGIKKWTSGELTIQGDYYYDKSSGYVRMYSSGNPAEFYADIELAVREHVVNFQNTSHVIFDGLSIKYGAAHGFGGGNTAHIIIRNCDISYIGGGDLDMDGSNVRFGNGIEFWGNAHDNLVERCRIWEIYDTGLSNQNHTQTVQQYNIYYRNNLIWNCALTSFEYWNRPESSTTDNIYFEDNTCLNAGEGWGVQRPDPVGAHVCFFYSPATATSVYIRNNVFYKATGSIFLTNNPDMVNGIEDFVMDYNNWYQPNGTDIVAYILYDAPANDVEYTMDEFSSYQADSGKEAHTITDDPLFVDISNLDFHLSSSSSCIDAGTDTGIKYDFDGNPVPINDVYDIGAYEYQE